jgi:hypothetical protein
MGLSRVLFFMFSPFGSRNVTFTVTRPVTIQKLSNAVALHDTILVFGKFYAGRLEVSFCAP